MARSEHAITRRSFCLCCIAAGGTVTSSGWLTPREVYAKAAGIVDRIRFAAARAPITVTSARGNVSVLEGSGGNIGVLSGRDGKVVIDAGVTASRPRIAEALEHLDGNPIRHLINTHWHFDHADGNEWMSGEGATILAHSNTKKHLESAQRVDDWDFDFPPAPPVALPTETFEKEMMLELNDTRIRLQHFAPAHTDSDIMVIFENADTIHVGDVYWNGIYPFIDYSTGGSIDGMIKAAEAVLSASGSETIIVPGHGGPLSNRGQLAEYKTMLEEIRGNVSTLKQSGMTVQECIDRKPTAAFDAKWGQFVISPEFFVRLVYKGV